MHRYYSYVAVAVTNSFNTSALGMLGLSCHQSFQLLWYRCTTQLKATKGSDLVHPQHPRACPHFVLNHAGCNW